MANDVFAAVFPTTPTICTEVLRPRLYGAAVVITIGLVFVAPVIVQGPCRLAVPPLVYVPLPVLPLREITLGLTTVTVKSPFAAVFPRIPREMHSLARGAVARSGEGNYNRAGIGRVTYAVVAVGPYRANV